WSTKKYIKNLFEDATRLIVIFFSALLEVDAPSESSEIQEIHNDLVLNTCNSWNQWKHLRVKWSGVQVSAIDRKYGALQLYREVDVLRWFKYQEKRDFPGIAILARIYLGKPLSTATQERRWLRCERASHTVR
ncbi:hypothetical protein JG687_00001708, partial [Phytophthora cactorum]